MKKNFLNFRNCLVAMVLTGSVGWFLYSCSSDKSDEPYSDGIENEYADLLNELEDYADVFVSQHKHAPQSRFLGWDKFKSALKADHVGYSENKSWIGSISESRKKWKELQQAEKRLKIEEGLREEEALEVGLSEQQRQMVQQQVDSLKLIYLSDTTNVAAIHNASILQSLLDDDLEFETTEQLVKSVIASVEGLGIEVDDIDISKTVSEVDDFIENVYDESVSVMYSRLSQRNPDNAGVYRLLSHFLSSLEKLENLKDMIDFTNGYVDIIDKSGLPLEIKGHLKSNMPIAPGSFELWTEIGDLNP